MIDNRMVDDRMSMATTIDDLAGADLENVNQESET